MNDEKIIELFWSRDERAICETQEKYRNYCYSIAYRILNNKEDSEECVNDTYLGAWNAIPPARPNILSAFLGKITRNLALKRLRSKTAEKRSGNEALQSLDELAECIPDGQNAADGIDQDALRKYLNAFLYSLPVTERKVFICRYWYCNSVSDICAQFGFGQSKTKMMLSRTRQKLKSYLQERGVFI